MLALIGIGIIGAYAGMQRWLRPGARADEIVAAAHDLEAGCLEVAIAVTSPGQDGPAI